MPNKYHELMGLWPPQSYTRDGEANDYQVLPQANPASEHMPGFNPWITWVLNVRTGKYAFVSRNITRVFGYPSQVFTEEGVAFFNKLIHPADASYVWKLTQEIWEFLVALPIQQRKAYHFNRDYRFLKANGTYVHLLEQNTILQTDHQGNITHLLGVCTDISPWKRGNIEVASLHSADEQDSLGATTAKGQLQHRGLLSSREREIVKLLAEGYSSRKIASQLCISTYTVDTHRRNIAGKTKTKSAGELIQYAIHNGLI